MPKGVSVKLRICRQDVESVQIPRDLVVRVPLDKQRTGTKGLYAKPMPAKLIKGGKDAFSKSSTCLLSQHNTEFLYKILSWKKHPGVLKSRTFHAVNHWNMYPVFTPWKKIVIHSTRFSAVDVSERPRTCTLACRPPLKEDLSAGRPSCWLGDSVVTASAPAERNVLAVKTGSRICLESPRCY